MADMDLITGPFRPALESAFREAFAGALPGAAYPDAIRLLYRTYAAAQGKPRYGDKSPGYVGRMRLLAELFRLSFQDFRVAGR